MGAGRRWGRGHVGDAWGRARALRRLRVPRARGARAPLAAPGGSTAAAAAFASAGQPRAEAPNPPSPSRLGNQAHQKGTDPAKVTPHGRAGAELTSPRAELCPSGGSVVGSDVHHAPRVALRWAQLGAVPLGWPSGGLRRALCPSGGSAVGSDGCRAVLTAVLHPQQTPVSKLKNWQRKRHHPHPLSHHKAEAEEAASPSRCRLAA